MLEWFTAGLVVLGLQTDPVSAAPVTGNRFESLTHQGYCKTERDHIDVNQTLLSRNSINSDELKFLNEKEAMPVFDALLEPIGYCSRRPRAPKTGNRFAQVPYGSSRCGTEQFSKEDCEHEITSYYSSGLINGEEQQYLKIKGSAGSTPFFGADGITPKLVCPCGCFAPNTRLRIFDTASVLSDWIPIEDIVMDLDRYRIFTLADNSKISSPILETTKMTKFTYGPEKKPLVVINTKSGQELAVTRDHAVLLANGTMVEAQTLQRGQHLVSDTGALDEIVSVTSREFEGDVLNIQTSGKSLLSHLVLAEHLIVGDLVWQNELKGELNRVIVRQ